MDSRIEVVNDSREPGPEDLAILSYWMVELNTEELKSDLTESMRGLVPTNCWCGSVLAVWWDGSKKYMKATLQAVLTAIFCRPLSVDKDHLVGKDGRTQR